MALLRPLIAEFTRVSASTTSTPIELIVSLITSHPDQFKFTCDLSHAYWNLITFAFKVIDKQFVGCTASSLDRAIESAANQMCEYLEAVAAADEEQPDSSGLLSRLCSSTDELNEEVAQLEIDICRTGYTVQHENVRILDDSYDIVYKCTIEVPGVGVFAGQSPKRHQGYKEAVTKLKNWYQEEFEKKQKLSSSEVVVDELTVTKTSQSRGSRPPFQSKYLYTIPATPSAPPQRRESDLASLMRLQSYSLMTLLNEFNSVFHPQKYPAEMIEALIIHHLEDISISTEQDTEMQLFTTTLKALNLLPFEVTDRSAEASLEKIMTKYIRYLFNLTRFFALFRKVNNHEKRKDQIFEELLTKDNTKRMRLKVMPPCTEIDQHKWKTSISIVNLFVVTWMDESEEYSRRSAGAVTIDRLRKFSAKLTISKFITASSEDYRMPFRPYDGNMRVVLASEKATASGQLQCISRHIRLIMLLNDFNSVCDLQKSPREVLVDLLTINKMRFEVKTYLDEDKQHLTTLDNADLGVLFSQGKTKADSMAKVLEQAFTVLLRLNALVADFISLYSPTAPPIDYIPLLIARNSDMITFRVYQRQPSGVEWQASLDIQHLQHFNASAKTRVEVIRATFGKVVECLVLFAEHIHRKIPPKPVPTKAEAGDVAVSAVYKHNRERIELLNGFISSESLGSTRDF